MAGLSNYLEDAIANHVFGSTPLTAPSNRYVKLHIGDPGEAGTSNAATETTRKSATFAASSGGVIATNADLDWTSYPAAETVSHVSVWDHVSAGNCLAKGALTASKAMQIGDSLKIPSGSLTITFD